MVEQGSEEPCVDSSILSLGTTKIPSEDGVFVFQFTALHIQRFSVSFSRSFANIRVFSLTVGLWRSW